MKKINTLFFAGMLLLSTISFAQVSYTKTFDITFSGGNNGSFSGNLAADVVPTINSVDGLLDVAVNLVNAPWSVMWFYMGNCWTKDLVLDQTNRYIEFRIKCNVAQLAPMEVTMEWGGKGPCGSQTKTWGNPKFIIPEADVWTIVLLKIPATTGGSQNLIDTVTPSIAWNLKNGNYSFDYVKMGTAAAPPKPTIDAVKTKTVSHTAGIQTVNLTGISIPGRYIDGLTIKAESLSDGIVTDVNILDLGSGPFAVDEATNIATAALQYNPVVGMGGLGDSIIITLKDTIRGTITKSSFYVNLLTSSLANRSSEVNVYPTNVSDFVNIELTSPIQGEVTVTDILGHVVATRKIDAASSKVDLSAVAPGLYIVKISDGKGIFTHKITKE